ncbi:hypothetical protein PCASD_26331 [Puccinia coronata f. sp. avenae]|uniref:Uncharacterized protein n=1 Tax=Puccinia coronata f. sp. avenae TaxID=200324 RepID=A0A2N5TH43_9BASI|nr:hypothetical protein PCASD_26331 [Puccinia coronata f. sp. avenae]
MTAARFPLPRTLLVGPPLHSTLSKSTVRSPNWSLHCTPSPRECATCTPLGSCIEDLRHLKRPCLPPSTPSWEYVKAQCATTDCTNNVNRRYKQLRCIVCAATAHRQDVDKYCHSCH